MNHAIIILGTWLLGILIGFIELGAYQSIITDAPSVVLSILLFLIGLQTSQTNISLRSIFNGEIAAALISILVGSCLPLLLIFVLPETHATVITSTSGLGYYSYSFVNYASHVDSEILNVIFLVSFLREQICWIFAPVIARFYGGRGLVCAFAVSSDSFCHVINTFSNSKSVELGILVAAILGMIIPLIQELIIHTLLHP